MPWQERTVMAERLAFVAFAAQEGTNIAALCRRFGISRKTGDTWLARAAAGETGVRDRSRRPQTSPGRTIREVEDRVLALRAAHPAWGGRNLHQALARQGLVSPPAPSTITALRRRYGRLAAAAPPRDFVRCEHAAPTDLWPLEFMGHRALDQGRGHPLTLRDEHSRFALTGAACADERQPTGQEHVTASFRRSGVPRRILSDNGSPWGSAGMGGRTTLEAWLVQRGIAVWHGRAYHPQTPGKVERRHRTIAAEGFAQRPFADLATTQTAFTPCRTSDNHERPHAARDFAVPASRYQPSPRPFPETLPEITYGPDDAVRTVTVHGSLQWRHRRYFVSRGLVGRPVAVRPTAQDGRWAVSFCHCQVATIDLNDPQAVSPLSPNTCHPCLRSAHGLGMTQITECE